MVISNIWHHFGVMAKPCAQCGSTKTRPTSGLRARLVKIVGWRLRRCSKCRRLRLLPAAVVRADRAARIARHRERQRGGSLPVEAPAPVPVAPPIAPLVAPEPAVAPAAAANDAEVEDKWERSSRCPYCGTAKTRPSKRTLWDHLLGRAKMMKCDVCWKRFPRRKVRQAIQVA